MSRFASAVKTFTAVMALALVGLSAAAPGAGEQQLSGSSSADLAPVVVDSAGFVEDVRTDLTRVGIGLPTLDEQLLDTVDKALLDTVPGAVRPKPTEGSGDPVTGQEEPGAGEAPAQAYDPNYVWKTDLSSRIMAGKPQAGQVLHRAPDSHFDAPRKPADATAMANGQTSLYGPGTPLYVGNQMCTLTVAGYDAAGRKIGITTGHCGEPGAPVASADSWEVGQTGTVVQRNDYFDYAVIEFHENAEISNSYHGVTAGALGGAAPAVGEVLCKQGVATGYTCGNTWVSGEEVAITQLCAAPGDSGAPVMRGGQVVGYVRGPAVPLPGAVDGSCRTPLQGQLFVPTATFNLAPALANINESGGPGAGLTLPAN